MVERYARQELLEHYAGQSEKLANLRIGIIGVGGLGGLCSLLLANAGVGTLRIADADIVELHNLHRQLLFTESSVGKSKVQCAAENIRAHNSATKVEVFEQKLTEANFAEFTKDLDILLDLSDDSMSRHVISQCALASGLDLVSSAVSCYKGMIAFFGYSIPDFAKKHGCYRCLTHGALVDTKQGITGPIAASLASFTAHLTLEYLLTNKSLAGQAFYIDLAKFNIRTFQLSYDPFCPHCGHDVD